MNKTIKILVPVAAAAVLSSVSQGATVTYTRDSGVIQTDFPSSTVITVPGFDGGLNCREGSGSALTGVTVHLRADLASQGTLTNPANNQSPITATVTVGGPFTLTLPAGSANSSLVATPNINFGATTVNPGVTANLPATGANAHASGSGLGGNWSGATVSLPISTLIGQSITGGGGANVSLTLTSFGLATVDVTYESQACVIPEPKVYGAVGALLSLGLLGYRNYRAKKA